MNHYKTISSRHVSADTRIPALQMLVMCREHLGVEVEYEWIAPCEAPEAALSRRNDIAGLYSAKTNTVYLRGDVAPDRLVNVAAHEMRHAWQTKNWGRPRKIDSPIVEADAERYADAAVRQFLGLPAPEWDHLAKPESFPLQKSFDADPAQLQDFVLTRLRHMNLMFK